MYVMLFPIYCFFILNNLFFLVLFTAFSVNAAISPPLVFYSLKKQKNADK